MQALAIAEIICAIYLGISLIGQYTEKVHTESLNRLMLLSVLSFYWLISDALCYLLNGPQFNRYVLLTLNIMTYSLSNLVLLGYSYYCDAYLRERTILSRWVFRIPMIVMCANIVWDIKYILDGHVIVYKDGFYETIGTAPTVVFVTYVVLSFYAPVVAIIKRKEVGVRSIILMSGESVLILTSLLIIYYTGYDLSVIFGSFGTIIAARLLQNDLKQNRLGEALTFTDFLLETYISAYYFGLDDGTCQVYKHIGQVKGTYPMNTGDMTSFSNLMASLISPEDVEGFHNAFDPKKMKERLKVQSGYTYVFHDMVNGEKRSIRMQVIRGADEKHAAVSFEDITKEIEDQKKRVQEENETQRLKKAEIELHHEQLRREVMSYLVDHDDDPVELLKLYAERLRVLINCDQIIYRDLEKTRIMVNAPDIENEWSVPEEYCRECEHFDAHSTLYFLGYTEMENCQEGWQGVPVHECCPVKSSLTRLVYCDGEVAGYLAIHYIKNNHKFSDLERDTLEEFTRIMSISLSRYEARKENKELKLVREMQKQLQDALAMADSANRAKTEFLFNMSHDIRTPMNAILGYTDIALRHEEDSRKVHDSLTKIKISGGHLLNLINDILEMSRIEAGKFELAEAPVNIREIVEAINHMSLALANTKDVSYHAALGEMENPYIYADELHINQILINLISNAVKYTDGGGKVEFAAEQIGRIVDGVARYRFTVKDNGIGMSEDFQQHLFENFSREDTSTVTRQEGTGLGLSIVKRITDLAQGRITVQSQKGVGSVFIVELPFRVMDEEEIRKYQSERLSEGHAMSDTTLEGRLVLLVEDNEMNREIATEILEENGLKVETANDGDVAVRMVTEKGSDYYDFILMDIQMPTMNGYEATAEIRKLPRGEYVPIIALSANAFKEDRDKSRAAGINAHVAKPIDVKTLLTTMHTFAR